MKALSVRTAFLILKHAIQDVGRDRLAMRSASLAYYAIFSAAPLILIMTGITALFLGKQSSASEIFGALQIWMGADATEAIRQMVQSSQHQKSGAIASSIGFVTLVIGATTFFVNLQDALNSVWKVTSARSQGPIGWIRVRGTSFLLILFIALFLLLSLLLGSIIVALGSLLNGMLPGAGWIWTSLHEVFALAMDTLLFGLVFKTLPDVKLKWTDVTLGGFFTAILFEFGKLGVEFYLGTQAITSVYGAAGSVLLILLWTFYSSLIFLFGAELTRYTSIARRSKITLKKGARWTRA